MIAFKSIFPCSERVLADGNIHEDIFLYMEQNSSICREPAENIHHGNPTMVQLQAHRPLLTTKIVSHALLPFRGRKEQKVLLEQHRPVLGRPVLLLLLCDSSWRAGMKGNACNTVLPEDLYTAVEKVAQAGYAVFALCIRVGFSKLPASCSVPSAKGDKLVLKRIF